jgi:hypothetical protein
MHPKNHMFGAHKEFETLLKNFLARIQNERKRRVTDANARASGRSIHT